MMGKNDIGKLLLVVVMLCNISSQVSKSWSCIVFSFAHVYCKVFLSF